MRRREACALDTAREGALATSASWPPTRDARSSARRRISSSSVPGAPLRPGAGGVKVEAWVPRASSYLRWTRPRPWARWSTTCARRSPLPVIVVDDGSVDATAEVASDHGAIVVQTRAQPRQGRGDPGGAARGRQARLPHGRHGGRRRSAPRSVGASRARRERRPARARARRARPRARRRAARATASATAFRTTSCRSSRSARFATRSAGCGAIRSPRRSRLRARATRLRVRRRGRPARARRGTPGRRGPVAVVYGAGWAPREPLPPRARSDADRRDRRADRPRAAPRGIVKMRRAAHGSWCCSRSWRSLARGPRRDRAGDARHPPPVVAAERGRGAPARGGERRAGARLPAGLAGGHRRRPRALAPRSHAVGGGRALEAVRAPRPVVDRARRHRGLQPPSLHARRPRRPRGAPARDRRRVARSAARPVRRSDADLPAHDVSLCALRHLLAAGALAAHRVHELRLRRRGDRRRPHARRARVRLRGRRPARPRQGRLPRAGRRRDPVRERGVAGLRRRRDGDERGGRRRRRARRPRRRARRRRNTGRVLAARGARARTRHRRGGGHPSSAARDGVAHRLRGGRRWPSSPSSSELPASRRSCATRRATARSP